MKNLLLFASLFTLKFVFSQAVLPTYCTNFAALPFGWTEAGIGTQPTHDDCSGVSKRYNAVGNSITINFVGIATNLKYSISRNGAQVKTLIVEQSPTGAVWTTIATWTEINTPLMATIQNHALLATTRFVRFRMSVRAGGRMETDMTNIYNTTPDPVGGACKLSPLNCQDAKMICSDATFSGNSDDFGTQELNVANQGCLSTEHQSSWYYFQPNTPGNMQISLNPTAGIDYDFAIWQTNNCAALGAPLRCSFSAMAGSTGLAIGSGDVSEGAGGDGWVNEIALIAGQTYIMLIDNFTTDNTSFNIDFTLTGGATLDCTPTPLPIELSNFKGEIEDDYNFISWNTESEHNNDYFTLERSRNGIDFEMITIIAGAGNSSSSLSYKYRDDQPFSGVTYYRLKQTDFDGEESISQIISLNRKLSEAIVSDLYPNPTNESFNFDLSTSKGGKLSIILLDNTGRIMINKSMNAVAGSNAYNVDVNDLLNGVYSIQIIFEHLEFPILRKLIKN